MKWKIPENLTREQLRPLLQPIIDYYLVGRKFNAKKRDAYLDAHEELVMQFSVTTSVWADKVCAVLSGFSPEVGEYQDAMDQYLCLSARVEYADYPDPQENDNFDLEEKPCCPADQLGYEEN